MINPSFIFKVKNYMYPYPRKKTEYLPFECTRAEELWEMDFIVIGTGWWNI